MREHGACPLPGEAVWPPSSSYFPSARRKSCWPRPFLPLPFHQGTQDIQEQPKEEESPEGGREADEPLPHPAPGRGGRGEDVPEVGPTEGAGDPPEDDSQHEVH